MRSVLLDRLPAAALALMLPLCAAAQVQCWTPREIMDGSVKDKRFAVQLAWIDRAEQIVRANQAFLDPPEPVRMRTSLSVGPYHPSGAYLWVRAYPEKTSVGIDVWTGSCNVIPEAERVAASAGQIDVSFNIDAAEHMRLTGGQPRFEGMVGGYPRYNGRVFVSRDGRLPWIPQTLADRIDAEIKTRERALADWRQQMARLKIPDPARMAKAAEAMRKTDPTGAEKLLASLQEQERELRYKQQEVYPRMTAQFERELADAREFRSRFSAEELRQPAMWSDADGSGKRALEARIRELNTPSAEEEQAVRNGVQPAVVVRNARRDRIAPLLRQAQAEYALTYLKPGPTERAIAFKHDPDFPDMKQPDRLQLITLVISESKRRQRAAWMQRAKESLDFAALAAMLD